MTEAMKYRCFILMLKMLELICKRICTGLVESPTAALEICEESEKFRAEYGD